MTQGFSAAERAAMADALLTGRDTPCPRCGTRLEIHEVPPSSAVAYVRRRVLLVCAGCGCREAVDLRELERRRPPTP